MYYGVWHFLLCGCWFWRFIKLVPWILEMFAPCMILLRIGITGPRGCVQTLIFLKFKEILELWFPGLAAAMAVFIIWALTLSLLGVNKGCLLQYYTRSSEAIWPNTYIREGNEMTFSSLSCTEDLSARKQEVTTLWLSFVFAESMKGTWREQWPLQWHYATYFSGLSM